MVDSREQTPISFSHPYITEVIRRKLLVADYGVIFEDGTEPPVYFERKGSLEDLYSTLTSNHDRFIRELERGKKAGYKIILIINATFSDILFGCKHSKVQGLTIIRQLFTLYWKYGLQFVCVDGEKEMATYITECYCSIGRMKKKESNEVKVAV